MLNPAINKAYSDDVKRTSGIPGVRAFTAPRAGTSERTEGQPALLMTDSGAWLQNEKLHQEIFGPATVLVACSSEPEFLQIAEALDGSLTATIHGTPDELKEYQNLVSLLSTKADALFLTDFPQASKWVTQCTTAVPIQQQRMRNLLP